MNALFQTFMQVARNEIANAPDGLLVADLASRSRRELGSSKLAHEAIDRLEACGEVELRAVGRDVVAFPSPGFREAVYELVASREGPVGVPDVLAAFPNRTRAAAWSALNCLYGRRDIATYYRGELEVKLRR